MKTPCRVDNDSDDKTVNKFIVPLFLVLLVLHALVGCGTTQQIAHLPDQSKLIEEQGKGRIYVIGSPLFMNLASNNITITVAANEKLIGYIVGHGYLCWERDPGTETIVALPEAEVYYGGHYKSKSTVDLYIENGKVYYVLLHIFPAWENVFQLHPGGGEIHTKLEIVTEEQGKEELLKCKPPEKKE